MTQARKTVAVSNVPRRVIAESDRERVIQEFTHVVKAMAHRLAFRLPAYMDAEDLISVGIMGLMDAMDKYDPTREAKFKTYAEFRIRGAMLDEIRKGDWTPRSVHRKAREVAAAIRAVEIATGREADDRSIAEQLGISLAEYHEILADLRGQKILSLDESGTDDESEIHRVPAPGCDPLETVGRESLFKRLASAIDLLPEREKLVLSLYYDEELHLKEIGAVLGVSESRVSQLHSQALARLRARVAGGTA